mmetsp:Transcript_12431/g.33249  ORF Transcript_12431/g.33249 Transcript_12431/m.33249 type:complete len:234 (+) Transcript_12431:1241-1942(+)
MHVRVAHQCRNLCSGCGDICRRGGLLDSDERHRHRVGARDVRLGLLLLALVLLAALLRALAPARGQASARESFAQVPRPWPLHAALAALSAPPFLSCVHLICGSQGSPATLRGFLCSPPAPRHALPSLWDDAGSELALLTREGRAYEVAAEVLEAAYLLPQLLNVICRGRGTRLLPSGVELAQLLDELGAQGSLGHVVSGAITECGEFRSESGALVGERVRGVGAWGGLVRAI